MNKLLKKTLKIKKNIIKSRFIIYWEDRDIDIKKSKKVKIN